MTTDRSLRAIRGYQDVSPALEQEIQSAIGHIYNLQFYDANKSADTIIRERPDHPAGHFFKAMVEWWRILTNFQDESRDDTFEDMLETVIDICDERLEENPDDVTALFFKGGALGFRGRLRANQRELGRRSARRRGGPADRGACARAGS